VRKLNFSNEFFRLQQRRNGFSNYYTWQRGEKTFLFFPLSSRRQQLQVMLKGRDLGTSETN